MLRVAAPRFQDVSRLVQAKQEVAARTQSCLDALSSEALNPTLVSVPERWIGPVRIAAFILLHVFTHAFHHEGQVAAMFRLRGRPIGDTDMQRA